jgi:hypothetical protein
MTKNPFTMTKLSVRVLSPPMQDEDLSLNKAMR